MILKPELYNFDDAHVAVLEKHGVPDLFKIQSVPGTFIFKVRVRDQMPTRCDLPVPHAAGDDRRARRRRSADAVHRHPGVEAEGHSASDQGGGAGDRRCSDADGRGTSGRIRRRILTRVDDVAFDSRGRRQTESRLSKHFPVCEQRGVRRNAGVRLRSHENAVRELQSRVVQ